MFTLAANALLAITQNAVTATATATAYRDFTEAPRERPPSQRMNDIPLRLLSKAAAADPRRADRTVCLAFVLNAVRSASPTRRTAANRVDPGYAASLQIAGSRSKNVGRCLLYTSPSPRD